MKHVSKAMLLMLICGTILCRNLKLDNKGDSSFYSSSSSSMLYSSSSSRGKDGKPKSHVRSISSEDYRQKQGDKPEEIRKYNEIYKRDNDQEGIMKKRAGTNVEVERNMLGDATEIQKLDAIREKDYFKDFNTHFHNSSFPALGNELGNFEQMENSFKNHGKYGKFLNEKAKGNLEHH
jgi:hypothetical protein